VNAPARPARAAGGNGTATVDLSAYDPPWWILNWGLGVDSTALLLRLFQLLESFERDGVTGAARDAVLADRLGLPGFTLKRLCVVVAMVGDEWPLTGELCTTGKQCD
jgi:hypothetical protein